MECVDIIVREFTEYGEIIFVNFVGDGRETYLAIFVLEALFVGYMNLIRLLNNSEIVGFLLAI